MSDVVLSEAPLWMQANQYPARIDRALLDALWIEGVITGLVMSPRAAGANLSVDVSAGQAVVQGDDQTNQGKYLARLPATVNVPTIAPPTGASQKRIDVLTVSIADPNAGGAAGSNAALHWVQGTATTGTPAVPAVPNSAVALGQVQLINGQTSVIAGDIASTLYAVSRLRSAPPQLCTSTSRPLNPPPGLLIFETDTKLLAVWDTTTWQYVDIDPKRPRGLLGYAERATDAGPIPAGSDDPLGVTLNVTTLAGRRIHIVGTCAATTSTAANDTNVLHVREDGATVAGSVSATNAGGWGGACSATRVLSPGAGLHTYALYGQRFTGTGSPTFKASATQPMSLAVYDVGAT